MAEITAPPDSAPGPPDPTPGDPAAYLVRRSEFDDQIEVLEQTRRRHTLDIVGLLVVAAAFLVLGVLYGTPGYVIATLLSMWTLLPLGRRMMTSHKIRRLGDEFARLEPPTEELAENNE